LHFLFIGGGFFTRLLESLIDADVASVCVMMMVMSPIFDLSRGKEDPSENKVALKVAFPRPRFESGLDWSL
jgi:hypothetical protein